MNSSLRLERLSEKNFGDFETLTQHESGNPERNGISNV